jgi:hypothetical protein
MVSVTKMTHLLPTGLTAVSRRRLMKRTIRRTYALWRRRFPRWANGGFDEYFLLNDALPLLNAMMRGARPDPAGLARLWVAAYGIPPARQGRALAEVTPVAAAFLDLLLLEHAAGQRVY